MNATPEEVEEIIATWVKFPKSSEPNPAEVAASAVVAALHHLELDDRLQEYVDAALEGIPRTIDEPERTWRRRHYTVAAESPLAWFLQLGQGGREFFVLFAIREAEAFERKVRG